MEPPPDKPLPATQVCPCGSDKCEPTKLVAVGMGEPERSQRPDGSTRLFWRKTTANGSVTMESTE